MIVQCNGGNCREFVRAADGSQGQQNPALCRYCAAKYTVRAWDVDNEDEPDEPNASDLDNDPWDVAKRYAEQTWESADGAREIRVNVRDAAGDLHIFVVDIDFDPIFTARKRAS